MGLNRNHPLRKTWDKKRTPINFPQEELKQLDIIPVDLFKKFLEEKDGEGLKGFTPDVVVVSVTDAEMIRHMKEIYLTRVANANNIILVNVDKQKKPEEEENNYASTPPFCIDGTENP